MYTLPRQNYLKQSFRANHSKQLPAAAPNHFIRELGVMQRLKILRVSLFGLWSSEGRYLPKIIHPSEQIEGVVYGRSTDGLVMLVATDRRVIYLDKKLLFVNEDEITYDVVSGVSYGHVGLGSTVSLHTRVKDYKIKTYNEKSAKTFVEAIESRCVEHKGGEDSYDYHIKNWVL